MATMKAGRRTVMAAALGATFAGMGLLSAPAIAEGLMDRAKSTGLRVAFYNFKPYAYKEDDGTSAGTLTGTDVDTLRAVLERMGGKIESADAVDWGALIPGVNAGRFDVVAAGMFVTPKRCASVRFSEPTFGIMQTLIVKKGNPHGVVNYDSVAEKDLAVAVISGSAHAGFARESGIPESKIMQIPDNPTAIAAVRADRAQLYALSVPGARALVAGVPEQDLEMVMPFDMVAGKLAMPHGAFAFRPEDSAFVNEFNKHLTAFIGSPEHLAIFKKHGMHPNELPRQKTADLCQG